jgi:hypothetical protein
MSGPGPRESTTQNIRHFLFLPHGPLDIGGGITRTMLRRGGGSIDRWFLILKKWKNHPVSLETGWRPCLPDALLANFFHFCVRKKNPFNPNHPPTQKKNTPAHPTPLHPTEPSRLGTMSVSVCVWVCVWAVEQRSTVHVHCSPFHPPVLFYTHRHASVCVCLLCVCVHWRRRRRRPIPDEQIPK